MSLKHIHPGHVIIKNQKMKGDHQEQLPMMKFSPEAVGVAIENFQVQQYIKVAPDDTQPESINLGLISVAETLIEQS